MTKRCTFSGLLYIGSYVKGLKTDLCLANLTASSYFVDKMPSASATANAGSAENENVYRITQAVVTG